MIVLSAIAGGVREYRHRRRRQKIEKVLSDVTSDLLDRRMDSLILALSATAAASGATRHMAH